MAIARTMSEHEIGTHSENSIAALKKHLGVDLLDLIVLNSVDEYYEMLVEVRHDSRAKTRTVFVIVMLVLVFVALSLLGDLDLTYL